MSMTETIKLYDRDAYATEFEADIMELSTAGLVLRMWAFI